MNYGINRLLLGVMISCCISGSSITCMEMLERSLPSEEEIELPIELWWYIYSLWLELSLRSDFTFSKIVCTVEEEKINSLALSTHGSTLFLGGETGKAYLLTTKSYALRKLKKLSSKNSYLRALKDPTSKGHDLRELKVRTAL